MKIFKIVSVVFLVLLFILCLTGTATADPIVTQSGNNYTVILDPNLHTSFNSVDYSLVGTSGVVYTETSLTNASLTIPSGDLTVSLYFAHPSDYLSDISISIGTISENVTIDLIAPSVGNPVNISITSATQYFNSNVIMEGNNHLFEMNDTISNQIVILNSNDSAIDINNLTLISTNNYVMPIQITSYLGTSTSVSIKNLNATGLVDFSGSSYSLYIENSIFEGGGLRADGMSGNSGSVYLMNSSITNGSIILGEFVDSSSIIGNRVSNNSNVLQFSNISAGVRHLIYNNYFEVSPSQDYVSINRCDEEIWFYCDDGIQPGVSIVGGPYLAGNYWSYSDGSGYSDGLSNSMGYVNTTYIIPTSYVYVGPGITFNDPHPLTKYVPSNGGGSNNTSLKITDPDQDETNQTDTNQTDSNGTNSDGTNSDGTNTDGTNSDGTNTNGANTNGADKGSGRKGLSGNAPLIQEMKENGQTLEDALVPMSTGAMIVSASAGSILMIISNLIDLFFDVTSKQARRLKFKFRMPKMSSFLTANSAFSLLFFFIGICIVDMLLGNTVDASMDHGFLMPVAAYMSPLIVMTVVNIGGGLFLDEIMDFILEKAGKLVNAKTGILDIIAANGNLNAIIVILLFIAAVAIVMLSIYLFDWSLI
jgi:hypothetical protein